MCLCAAIIYKKSSIARALLKAGADPNLPDPSAGGTPLHCAVLESDLEMIKLLIEYEADPTLTNKYGVTPWDLLDYKLRSLKFLDDPSLDTAERTRTRPLLEVLTLTFVWASRVWGARS